MTDSPAVPAWLVPGAAAAIVSRGLRGQPTCARVTIARLTKTQVVLEPEKHGRFRIGQLRRSTHDYNTEELVALDDPRVVEADTIAAVGIAHAAVQSAHTAWRTASTHPVRDRAAAVMAGARLREALDHYERLASDAHEKGY